MKRNGFFLCTAVLLTAVCAVHPAFGQTTASDFPAKHPSDTVSQSQRMPVTLQLPMVRAENNLTRNDGRKTTPANMPVAESAPLHENIQFTRPASSTMVSGESGNVQFSSVTKTVDKAPAPIGQSAQVARPIAQNAIIKNHRLRLSAQIFEDNLVRKLGSRFVPIKNNAETAGISRYNLPVKDGTGIELTIHQQHGIVSITGSPQMVEACLQIVQFLDTEDIAGRAVTRFVPVQDSNIDSARQVAGIMNQESLRIAQADSMRNDSTMAVLPNNTMLNAALPNGESAPGGVVGPVNIEIIEALGAMVIQGSPEDVAAVRAMIQQLEELSLENEPGIELIAMQHADSLRISQIVQQLYQQIYLNRRGAVTMLALVKPNTILAIGKKESLDAVKELIAKLDTAVDPQANFRVFRLKHADAQTLSNTINLSFTTGRQQSNQQLYPLVYAVPDQINNALIVQASPRDLEEVAEMIRQLDVPAGGEAVTTTKSIPMKYSIAANMVTLVQQSILGSYQGQTGTTRATQMEIRDTNNGSSVRSNLLYNVTIVADTAGNRVVVTAPIDTMPLIEQLIEQLDQPPTAQSEMKIFFLAHGDAYSLAATLTNFFAAGQATQVAAARPGFDPGDSPLVTIRFESDIRANAIIATGSRSDMVVAEALIRRLDMENTNGRQTFIRKIVNVSATEMETLLNNHFTAEREIEQQNITNLLPVSPKEQYEKEVNVVADSINNFLVITTTQRYYNELQKIIDVLDERPRMMVVDVLIAEITLNNTRDHGVELGLQDSILFRQPLPTSPLGFLTMPGSAIGTQGITTLGVGDGNGFSFSASSESVNMYIKALETRNKTQILSRPRLSMLHNQQAQVNVGQQVPYVTDMSVSQGTVSSSSELLDVGTNLDVTPRIMEDGMISMLVYVKRSSVSGWREVGQASMPELNNAEASTTINVMDGQTIVFAGLISEEKTLNHTSVPVVNRIPLIKHLFENTEHSTRRTELLITLTPRIVRSATDLERMNREEEQRMHWCVSDVVNLTGDGSIRRRTDEWSPVDVHYSAGLSVPLESSQLPPVPVITPAVTETQQ